MRKKVVFSTLVLMLAATTHLKAHAGDYEYMDVSTDMEEVGADSEAAIAIAKAAKTRIAQEKLQTDRALKQTLKARSEAKEQARTAERQLGTDEKIIDVQLAKQAKLKGELQQAQTEIALSGQAIQASQSRVLKKTQETEALNQLKLDKLKNLLELKAKQEQSQNVSEMSVKSLAVAKAELKTVVGQENDAKKALTKAQVDEAKQKAIALKEIQIVQKQMAQSKANIEKLQGELARLNQQREMRNAQLEAGQTELKAVVEQEGVLNRELAMARPADSQSTEATPAPQVTGPQASASQATPQPVAKTTDWTLKRDCKIHDGPKRTARVLGVKQHGQAVVEALNSKGWVSFTLDDGQKGFVATSCF